MAVNKHLVVLAAGTSGLGLVVGVTLGLLISEGDGEDSQVSVVSPTPQTPEPSMAPSGSGGAMPSEDVDWSLCEKPGLCDFVQAVDSAAQRRDSNWLISMVSAKLVDCAEARTLARASVYGVQPRECLDWSGSEPIPAAYWGKFGSEGGLLSIWEIRRGIDDYFLYSDGCSGQEGVRAVVLPPNRDFVFAGDASLLIGDALECERAERLWLGLTTREGGDWGVQSFMSTSGLGPIEAVTERPLYVNKFRYWPLGESN